MTSLKKSTTCSTADLSNHEVSPGHARFHLVVRKQFEVKPKIQTDDIPSRQFNLPKYLQSMGNGYQSFPQKTQAKIQFSRPTPAL